MQEGFAIWANPSSPHAEGRKAKQALEDARERVKRALGWDGEVIFTSGASEALWIALNRAKVDRRIVSAVEHDAVFRAAPDAEVVPLGEGPCVGRAGIEEAITDKSPAIIAIQHVNSETGTMQPVEAYAAITKQNGSLLLADCSQSAAKYRIPKVDLAVISAHKFGGPIGVGALLVRDFGMIEPIGGHERGYRQGTENLLGAMGMAAALDVWAAADEYAHWDAQEALDNAIEAAIAAGGQHLVTGGDMTAYINALAHPTLSAQAQLIRLDAMGFAVSAGSACSSGTLKKSRVLHAFGVDDDTAARTIRVSIGWNTTAEDLHRFAEAWKSLS